ncbi:hypothetical protein MXB_1486 [Myxobolus squamalis]|nr:hypothetical protein MXB_1486 [Myxobolus squamalis]
MDSCLDWRAKKKSDVEYDREKTTENISAAQSDGNWRSGRNTGDGSYGRVGDSKDENVSAAQFDDNWRSGLNAGEAGSDRIGYGKNGNMSAAQSDSNWRSGRSAGEGSSSCFELVENTNISAAQSDTNWRSNTNGILVKKFPLLKNWSSSYKGFEKKEYSFSPSSDNSRHSRLIPSKEYTGRPSIAKRYEDTSKAMSDNNWKSSTRTPHVASSSTSNTSKTGAFFDYRNKNKSANAWNVDQKKNPLQGTLDTNNNFDLSILRNPDKKIQAFADESSSTRPSQSTTIYK